VLLDTAPFIHLTNDRDMRAPRDVEIIRLGDLG